MIWPEKSMNSGQRIYINTVNILKRLSYLVLFFNKLLFQTTSLQVNQKKLLIDSFSCLLCIEEFTRKKCKTAILLYCFHTAGVLHIFMLYKLLGPGISFYRKSKIIVKRKPNYEIGWFHNWPMIISHTLYAFHFTNDDFPL